jgi:hypothetical protein
LGDYVLMKSLKERESYGQSDSHSGGQREKLYGYQHIFIIIHKRCSQSLSQLSYFPKITLCFFNFPF